MFSQIYVVLFRLEFVVAIAYTVVVKPIFVENFSIFLEHT